ncbi:hypothetical protein [Sphingomonas sp. Leaf21]|uniref:hypothetical protein n=1 Tax=Sphingomonas sp. Leaf21 TaxID=2876550 RepID=UPI001E345B6E|nr:hypothetical protein [Sphingomonas sp. Leaf21]
MPLTVMTAANGHSDVVNVRTHPELSDVALFVVAIGAIWFLRRALRRRNRKD